MKIGTPANIQTLLHFYSSPLPLPNQDSEEVSQIILTLLDAEVIASAGNGNRGSFRTTDKGDAWVKALCNVEEPRVAWIDGNGAILKPDVSA